VPAVPRRRHRRLDHHASLCPVWHRDIRQRQPGTGNRNTSARPHRPPDDSTPILIDRVRRKRQRLRSNGSIESDSAPPTSRSSAHLRAESLPIESCRLSRLIQNGIDERPFDRRRHVGVDYDKIERTASIGVSDLLPIGLTGAGNQNVERPSRCRYSHQQRFGTPRHVTSSATSGAPTQRDGHPGQPSPR
jgi:hypothetical protein